MLISYQRQFLFVHVAKAAGTSITRALYEHCHFPPRRLLTRGLAYSHVPAFHRMKKFPLHFSARDIRRELPRSVWDDLYKFAFVRNPWDRLVSSYHFLLSKPNHRRHKQVQELGSFSKFVRYELQRPWCSQFKCLSDRQGRLIMDYVGRFENLRQDFAIVCQQIGIQTRLPHLNMSVRDDYRDYFDNATRQLVLKHLADDVEHFGYNFDDPGYNFSASHARAA